MTVSPSLKSLTEMLNSAKHSSPEELEALWVTLVPELKRIAYGAIGRIGRSGRDGGTDLVLELYPALQRTLDRPATRFANRSAFFGYVAVSMRRALADRARRDAAKELLDDDSFAIEFSSPAVQIALDQALEVVRAEHPRAVQAFELRAVFGYGRDEILAIMSDQYKTLALISADLTTVRKRIIEILAPSDDA